MRPLRYAVTIVIASFCLLVAATPAMAQSNDYVGDTANALAKDPVFVDAKAQPTISAVEADKLRTLLWSAGVPIYIAMVDGGQFGNVSPHNMPGKLRERLNRSGIYVVSIPSGLQIDDFNLGDYTATNLSRQIDKFKREAYTANNDKPGETVRPAAVLTTFVEKVAHYVRTAPPYTPTYSPSPSTSSSYGQEPEEEPWTTGGVVMTAVLAALVGGLLGFLVGGKLLRRRVGNFRQLWLSVRCDNLSTKMLPLTNVGAASDVVAASADLDAARKLLEGGDLASAERYLDQAEPTILKAYQEVVAPDTAPDTAEEPQVSPEAVSDK